MNKLPRIILIAFFWVIFLAGHAQHSILWEVTGNGLSKPSYLLGTLKFIGEKEYYLPAEVNQRLTQCQVFAIEDQVDHRAQHELNKTLHLTGGKTISSLLTPEDYTSLLTLFDKEFKITKKDFEKRFSKLAPLALSITMTRLSLQEDLKYYDIELLKLAKKYQLDTYSLESVDRESEALKSFSLDDQVKALVQSIHNFETQKTEYKNLEAAYVSGDLNKVLEYTLHPMENNAAFVEEFYTKRNNEWLPKIEKMVKAQPSFVAVGVAHLEGENGLLALLRSKGFDLKPVEIKR